MKLDISFIIKLGDAKVELSHAQMQSVKGFVEKTLNGDAPKTAAHTKKRRRMIFGSRKWTAEELSELKTIRELAASMPTKDRQLAIRAFARKVGRTVHAVKIRLYQITTQIA